MSYTKRQFINAAFEEIGLASYVFDLAPDQFQSALQRLDAMLANWNAKGIRIGYNMAGGALSSDLDDETGVPDSAWEAIITNLAVKIAPSYGKTVSPDTKAIAKNAYDTLLQRAAMPPEQQLPSSLPIGSGNKPWRYDNPFVRPPVDPIESGQDGYIEFN